MCTGFPVLDICQAATRMACQLICLISNKIALPAFPGSAIAYQHDHRGSYSPARAGILCESILPGNAAFENTVDRANVPMAIRA
jgi:hypothetical protein